MILSSKGFTLIELLIASTLFFILVIMTYANYAFYGNIAKVKLSLKEISQSIADARNMAINGFYKNGVNQSVGIYFDKNNNTIKYYTFNYNSGVLLNEENLFKQKKLQEKVGINHISGKDNVLIYFSSIYGVPRLFYFDIAGDLRNFDIEELDFSISFNGNSNFPLKRDLKYIKNTNVVDY